MLDRVKLEQVVREHIRTEGVQDLEGLRNTLHENVEYGIKAPAYPDDPTPYGSFRGAETYLDMWRNLHKIFSSYEIELQKVHIPEGTNEAWLTIQATAVPREDYHGLPKNKPMCWWAAAICEFDDDFRMTRETVYGSFPPTVAGWLRMKAFTGR